MFHRISLPVISSLGNSVFATNPLVCSVLRENVRVYGGRAFIVLWPHWPSLLGEFCGFGRVLSVSRNENAVLGRLGGYPRVVFAPCGHCGGSPEGSHEFHFARWCHAVVAVEEQPGGWLYAVEFHDHSGETLHKVCLTSESDFGAFQAWVELNQAAGPGPGGGAWRRQNECGGENEETSWEPDGVNLKPEVMRTLLEGMIREKIRGQFVVGNEGMVQGADLLPASLRDDGDWVFLAEEDCGLHLRLSRISDVRLQRILWPEGAHWVLKTYEPEGRMVCVLAPPRQGSAADWDSFLLHATAPHQFDPPSD